MDTTLIPVFIGAIGLPIAVGFIAHYWDTRLARTPEQIERELRATIAIENFRNVQRARLEAERRRGA